MKPTDRPPRPLPLKTGDVRHDGFRFLSWRWRREKWIPIWLRPEVFERTMKSNKSWSITRRQTDPRHTLLKGAKSRAAQRGLPFNLTLADIEVPETCPVLGIPLFPSRARMTDHSPQLDRIVPSLGYVRGNVVVISKLANTIKSNATPDQIRSVADWYERTIRSALMR